MNSILKQFLLTNRFYKFLIVVTGLKLMAMGFFSSDYQYKMFMPFIDAFLSNTLKGGNVNPYEYYAAHNSIASFPYPPLMLYIECIGGMILHFWHNCPLFLQNIFFKLPNLAFDFLGLHYLMKLYPSRRFYIGILYFASPIVFYASYMHGQLDIIPTSLIIGSLYYLLSKKTHHSLYFTLFLASALATKLHILVLIPALFIYLLKKRSIFHSALLIGGAITLTLIIMAPFMGKVFFDNILFNKEQQLLTQVYLSYVNLKIYLPILAICLIYLQKFMLANINKDLFLSFCGILFVVFLVLLPPMPGWYIWIVPFITMFFISINENRYNNLYAYLGFNFLYIIYFLCFHQTNMVDLYFMTTDLSAKIHVSNDVLRNIVFTILTTLLAYISISMYCLGIISNNLYKRKGLPFTIGIAGDSGTGKSTLTHFIKKSLGEKNLLFIEGDGDHKWKRGEDNWNIYTHLNPKANYLYRQAADIQMLREGVSVSRVDYDHSTGNFTKKRKIHPNKYILLCGLHSFYLPQMRKVLDLTIYMDVDETLRRYWKIQRDIAKRSYNKTKILEQIEARVNDSKKYIIPQKNFADIIINYFDNTLKDYCAQTHEVVLNLKITLSSEVNLEPLVRCLSQYHIEIIYDYTEDLKKQIVIFDGKTLGKADIPLRDIVCEMIPQLDEITNEDLLFEDNFNGIIQLILLIVISYKMQGALKHD